METATPDRPAGDGDGAGRLDPARLLELLGPALADPRNGWSIGTFGAIGEFHRDPGEPADCARDAASITVATARGAIRIEPRTPARVVAYDVPGSDADTWSSELAVCLPAAPSPGSGVVTALGADHHAVEAHHRGLPLHDLGIGIGEVRFCVRTGDATALAALQSALGRPAEGSTLQSLMSTFLAAQPHRVLLSPVGRIEVTAPIPMPDGRSPEGPHTHLLPGLLASGRTHSANTPIPEGWQPVLTLHPPAAWRDGLGRRTPYSREADDAFASLAEPFRLPGEAALRRQVEAAVRDGLPPQGFVPPPGRRARALLRVALRRLAARAAPGPVAEWRAVHDRPATATAG